MQENTQRKNTAKKLIETMTEHIQGKKFDTNEEVLAYHHLISFLFSVVNTKAKSKEEKNLEEVKLKVLNELVTKNIFHSYQAVYKILEEPENHLFKMIPFIFCFQDFLEQKEVINSCDEEKISYLKDALLLSPEESIGCSKRNITLSNELK